ncbi:MAG: ABC transporter ATP-binding protein [Candidatus Krumholzibacteriota bacterium]|nr:ABC transporter ATP-binding protein [Candidatus Krumholzibacteriota bacterium]
MIDICREAIISIRGVSKVFAGEAVLDSLDLDIERGETLVVIGRSGCGKSVLLKHLTGLLKPDKGEIFFKDEDITRFSRRKLFEMRMHFGMLFQASALFDSMSVGDNVALPLIRHSGKEDGEIRDIVLEKLRLVGLEDVYDKFPAELSGGMKKRVGLARAVVMDPEVVLYDEPTTGLDPIMADVINELIRDLQRELNITSVVVTHDIGSAYKIADHMAMLYNGKIIFEGSPDETRETGNEIVRQFIEGRAVGPIKAV